MSDEENEDENNDDTREEYDDAQGDRDGRVSF
jgi:hypothetical protein